MRRIKIVLQGIVDHLFNRNQKIAGTEKERQESLLKELTRLNTDVTVKQINAGVL